jgi:hypothetical protein
MDKIDGHIDLAALKPRIVEPFDKAGLSDEVAADVIGA